ncbi:hypothetical protein RHGRI_028266 [Rhododendron griersonianum]|uniref:Uncharacterized protein n=1 Tax=Rhododendron griersonianum TaxID=479676 RepID=A0AAV6IKR2_9ERIC|nr:hypothetical protein RHGRI_028266 [Rhododendron griersonianum]
MWSVPPPVPPPVSPSSVAVPESAATAAVISPDSFSKVNIHEFVRAYMCSFKFVAIVYKLDGRKICVGDCALFKPPLDSPPFIGIIRKLLLEKEKNLRLSVNWLYRPADVKLGKGSLVEAAPNELFYSFHKDEIPAASLLHPCKVAFLRKGVELPSGISSFVCRRVYDIENKCLWWLTDQDYINERQEEVDQLLDKTRLEMYGAVQSGGRSPKSIKGPTGTPQLRPGSESVQNSSSSLTSSQVKGKKRDRADQGNDPVKRERVSRADDTDSAPEHVLRSEIAKITEESGLRDYKGVQRLVQLMRPISTEKKIDLACRIMLVNVIAVTDTFDCLGWFVQLRGLPVLDEWLQEVHKGKIGNASSPKESDKLVEEFLLVSLRALDKLPVNLHALQTCNVGKSVNLLRSHKNSEIQKKARALVDTWKKRVEAEMNMIDAKSGSSHSGPWPSKSLLSEVSHVGNRCDGGSSEATVKSSTVQSSPSKTPSIKLGSSDSFAKIVSASPASTQLASSASSSGGASAKDPNSATLVHGGSSDMPLSTIKEEKSSSSNQSPNNSQSCSSDYAKTRGASCREDARSSTGSASRHQKSSNGVQGSAVSGFQKEISLGKLGSLSQNLASETASPTRVTHERAPDAHLVDHGNNRLIVRLPNTGRSPARSTDGVSSEDPSAMLSQSGKQDHHDRKVKGKSDAWQSINTPNSKPDLCQGRDGLVVSDEGNLSAPNALCDEQSRTEDGEKLMESTKGTGSSSGVVPEPDKSHDVSSRSSMNVLIDSCVKFSEARTTVSGGDDIGMNLLASVAAGEMCRSDVLPSGSPGKNSPVPIESCFGNDVKLRRLDKDTANDRTNGGDMLEHGCAVDCLRVENESPMVAVPMSANISRDVKVTSFSCEEKSGECSGQLNPSIIGSRQNQYGLYSKCDGGPGEVNNAPVGICFEDDTKGGIVCSEGADQFHQQKESDATREIINSVLNSKLKARIPFPDEDKVNYADEKIAESRVVNVPNVAASTKVENKANEKSPSCSSLEVCREDKSALLKELGCAILTEQKVPIILKFHQEVMTVKGEDTALPSGSATVLGMESNTEKATDTRAVCQSEQSENQNINLSTASLEQTDEFREEKTEGKQMVGHCSDKSASHEEPLTIPMQRTVECMKSNTVKLDGNEAGGIGECASSVNGASGSVAGTDVAVKLDFDLNEGFPVEDGCQGELVTSSVVHLPCPLPFSVSSPSMSFPFSITVTSAAKGPFCPPENPLRSKGKLGWKGSAATSAFKPAEPRKVLEMPLRTTNSPSIEFVRKPGRSPLDIDLNVPDQRVLEDMDSHNSSRAATCLEIGPLDNHGGGGLDLDLNRVDDSPDIRQFSVSNRRKMEIPLTGGLSNGEFNASRDFDLNNGPGPYGGVTEPARHVRGNVPFLSPLHGVRMNTMDQGGSYSSLFPPNNSYSAIAIPSILPGRGEQSYSVVPASGSQRILGGPSRGSPIGPEFYRGTVLPSSPAISFPHAAPFQYPGFPFETNFSLPSNSYSVGSTAHMDSSSLCLPTIPSQLVGLSGVVSSQYSRPYIMNLPGGANNVGPESRKLGGQGLDLNNGTGSTDVERRDGRPSPALLRQIPVPGSQTTPVDEQMKVFQMASGSLKRREPDLGWNGDRNGYKQPSWQ